MAIYRKPAVVIAFFVLALCLTLLLSYEQGKAPLQALGSFANVNVTNNSSRQNEPMVAINPTNYDKLVVGYNDQRSGYYHVGWSWSDNAGVSWTRGGEIAMSGYNSSADPVVAFDNAGTAYLSGIAYNSTTTPGYLGQDGSIFLAKSNDGGHTFTVFQKIVAYGSGYTPHLDKPWMAINPANNHIYLAWARRQNAWNQATEAMTIWLTRSTDGGTTFSTPIQVSTFSPATGSNRSHGPQIYPGLGNTVYVSWHTIEAGTAGQPGWTPPRIFIAESTDGGATFGTNYQAGSQQYGLPNRFISMGVHRATGKIFIAYADRPVVGADPDVYVAMASAASGPWTSQRVSDDPPGNGHAQFWPSLAVAPNGCVDVLWYDQRNEPLMDVYTTSSHDGGVSWTPNVRITPGYTGSADSFCGDYNTIASVNDFSQLVWTDNRTGNQEIFTARVTVNVVSPNGGESLTVGSSYPIAWTGYGGPVKIEYSTNNGSTLDDDLRTSSRPSP